MSLAVAVVDAETPGNVGSIARAMKNFAVEELLLVDPPELDPEGEAYAFAGQAREDVLPEATELSFDDLATSYHTIGFTAIPNEDDRSHVRYPVMQAADLSDRLASVEADTALVFGRERVGLTNDELARIDEVCTIPASESYPVLNLAQAATIALYECREYTLGRDQLPEDPHARADERAIEGLHEEFAGVLEAVGHPEEKRAKTARLWRRVLGRADPTGREVRTLRGIFRRIRERTRD
ncbi:RNA methyltransferase [Halococcoides cellulosivorans]|uniref:RNA methyltransferase n=1 Tax=Halococcoides cellulosivorans TaxID=1679096 RepID=A0A2R4X1W5_9EURY|nr:TrmH family RNA methyltransferase [Halococcoides cellulosivorans]AWB27786.1 RNA methyltransferase [Halococcoides cellulosivorans]